MENELIPSNQLLVQKEMQIQPLEMRNKAYLSCTVEPNLDVCAGPMQGQWHPQPGNDDDKNNDQKCKECFQRNKRTNRKVWQNTMQNDWKILNRSPEESMFTEVESFRNPRPNFDKTFLQKG